jgi:hypothetical protein
MTARAIKQPIDGSADKSCHTMYPAARDWRIRRKISELTAVRHNQTNVSDGGGQGEVSNV